MIELVIEKLEKKNGAAEDEVPVLPEIAHVSRLSSRSKASSKAMRNGDENQRRQRGLDFDLGGQPIPDSRFPMLMSVFSLNSDLRPTNKFTLRLSPVYRYLGISAAPDFDFGSR